jgi:hypothetical protein
LGVRNIQSPRLSPKSKTRAQVWDAFRYTQEEMVKSATLAIALAGRLT